MPAIDLVSNDTTDVTDATCKPQFIFDYSFVVVTVDFIVQ